MAPARYEDVAILLAAAQGGVLHLMHSHHTFLLHEERLMLQQVEPLLKGVLSVVWDDDRGAEELEVGDHVPPGPLQAGGPGHTVRGGEIQTTDSSSPCTNLLFIDSAVDLAIYIVLLER